jgi:hypothetical protein
MKVIERSCWIHAMVQLSSFKMTMLLGSDGNIIIEDIKTRIIVSENSLPTTDMLKSLENNAHDREKRKFSRRYIG